MFFKKADSSPADSARIDLEDRQSCSYWKREHYIPIRKADLITRLSSELSGEDRNRFLELCRLLDAMLSLEFNEILDDVKAAYAAANPDVDTHDIQNSEPGDDENLDELFARFESILKRANFQKLSGEQIQEAVGTASQFGVRLKLNLNTFNRLDVYVRGDIVHHRHPPGKTRSKVSPRIDVPIYQRLVAVFQPNDKLLVAECDSSDFVYLKLMKNVPHQDVDMMLPGGRVQISMLDGGKILWPTVSGLCIAGVKIFKGAVILAVAGFYHALALLLFVFGTLGYGMKSFIGYRQIKAKYEHDRTRSMYFRNLDNNAGVLHRLIDEAHEQELRETVLGYFVLWQDAGEYRWTAEQIDWRAESKLRDLTKIDIDFEVDDAVAKLERYGLIVKNDDGSWRAERIHRAISAVDSRLHSLLP